jgi:hypothetical protein
MFFDGDCIGDIASNKVAFSERSIGELGERGERGEVGERGDVGVPVVSESLPSDATIASCSNISNVIAVMLSSGPVFCFLVLSCFFSKRLKM